jgi:hypothetical protein
MLAGGLLATGITGAGAVVVAQQGQPQAPEIYVYKTPT